MDLSSLRVYLESFAILKRNNLGRQDITKEKIIKSKKRKCHYIAVFWDSAMNMIHFSGYEPNEKRKKIERSLTKIVLMIKTRTDYNFVIFVAIVSNNYN